MKENKGKIKEFFATSWAIDNRASVYVLTIFITILGILSYNSIPKEQFPEIIIPTIIVNTVYPGTSPEDIENLVTRPIEKEAKALADVKTITSNSVQDFSMVVIEFNPTIEVSEAKQRVRDAVDKAKPDLPTDLPKEPDIMQVDLSEIPIMFINISGDYDLQRLKKYADDTKDRIEGLKEITRVDIVGALDREIQIDVDMYKMQAASVAFSDLERAIASENVTISAGTITNFGSKRSIRIAGQFKNPEEIKNIMFKTASGAVVHVKDVAEVKDSFKEQESFSRINGKNVITLNVIKKSGENLLNASDKINEILLEMKTNEFPPDLDVNLTGEQSKFTRSTLEELNNTAIIGFILVTIILMFFMGLNNAFFVGLSVPLSMFVAFLIIPNMGFTMNMIVMFAFIFALGIIVDDAIVVIENTHRTHRFEPDITKAAKNAAGEVFLPILSGTLTTLAPFFPLIFWPGIVGKFMSYLPITLIISLFASLFVAYIMNPVFAVSFMAHEYEKHDSKPNWKKLLTSSGILIVIGLLFHMAGWKGFGNFFFFFTILNILYRVWIKGINYRFQNKWWPEIMNFYERNLRFFLCGNRPWYLLGLLIVLFFLSFIVTGITKPKVLFFPNNEPQSIDIFLKMPQGTDQIVTDSVTKIVEGRAIQVLGKDNPYVESMVSNVGFGAGSGFFDRSVSSNLGKVTINFVESRYRQAINTQDYLDRIRENVKNIPGVEISVAKNQMGPPTGKPVNIEVSSENLDELITVASHFHKYLDSLRIPGVEKLKSNFESGKPEIMVKIDRERANREGISMGQLGMELRTAIYGKEISKYKEDEDEYPIQLRYSEEQRKNINNVINGKITYRDMTNGQLRQIPISSVASIDFRDTYGGINRKNVKRMITISSEVLSGYTANEVVASINRVISTYPAPKGVTIKMTGEQEDQAETMNFLFKAMIIAIGVIFFILISQFSSVSKSLIILSEVVFSIIGVLFGIAIFGMSISVLMTGLGIVALGGIVVRNGILIVEFCDTLKARGLKIREAVVQAGKTRTTPVILTATATMLGLVPLAVGMNIDFISAFTELNPHIYFGGDNGAFWGPLSWTIIFGLSFATFLTLIFVPAMYLIDYKMKLKWKRKQHHRRIRRALKAAG